MMGVLPMIGRESRMRAVSKLSAYLIAACAGMFVAMLMSGVVAWQAGPASPVLSVAYWFFSLLFVLPLGLVVGVLSFGAGMGAQRAVRAIARRGDTVAAFVGGVTTCALGCVASVLAWQALYVDLGSIALVGGVASVLGGGVVFGWLSRSAMAPGASAQ